MELLNKNRVKISQFSNKTTKPVVRSNYPWKCCRHQIIQQHFCTYIPHCSHNSHAFILLYGMYNCVIFGTICNTCIENAFLYKFMSYELTSFIFFFPKKRMNTDTCVQLVYFFHSMAWYGMAWGVMMFLFLTVTANCLNE